MNALLPSVPYPSLQLIILDLGLTRMDTFDAAKAIRNLELQDAWEPKCFIVGLAGMERISMARGAFGSNTLLGGGPAPSS